MKKILFLFAICATLFACTKDSSVPQDQSGSKKVKVLTVTQLSDAVLSEFGTASIVSVEKTPTGNKINIHVETDATIYQAVIQVMSDSTLGKWSGLGGFNWPFNFYPVKSNPYDNYVIDPYVANNPQARTYKGWIVVDGGSIDLGQVTVQ